MKTAFQHPAHRREVVLPDGYTMTRAEAEAKGYTVAPWPYTAASDKIATVHPHKQGLAVLQHGVVVTEETAKAIGYAVKERASAVAPAPLSPHRAWRAAIVSSAEAHARPDAAAELVMSQTEATMSVDAARAFLRGLPAEQVKSAPPVAKPAPDTRATRLAEIAQSTTLLNKNNGHKPKAGSSVSTESLDPSKLKRLAEIRLAALTQRMEQGELAVAHEHKKLVYAFSVHNQTGMPLAAAFKQLSVDTSKMLADAR